MFARAVHRTPDMLQVHRLLTEVAAMVDDGLIKTTLAQHYGVINAANLRRAHAFIESGRSIGKIVLAGFGG
jgi:NADPH:quinone reductase-like Zn-dependent oxidoreductase